MTDKTMTLEQVRDYLRREAEWRRELKQMVEGCKIDAMADAITRHFSQPAERGDVVAEVVIGATRCYSDDEWYREVTAAGICFLAPLDQQDAAISLIGRGIKPRTAPPPAAGVPSASGVSRMSDNDRAVMVSFRRALTDAELRAMHDMLSAAPSPEANPHG